ncbi:hypothetical protein GCM10009582_27720 [Arthrobacter flavus]
MKAWFAEEAVTLSAIHDPSVVQNFSMVIVVDARNASEKALCLTLATLMSGTVQRCAVQIIRQGGLPPGEVENWISGLSRVCFIGGPEAIDLQTDLVLVVPAGVIFGRYSIEAAVEAKSAASCELLRTVIDGSNGTGELWAAEPLRRAKDRSTAEAEVRKRGGERWVSGSSLGLRYMGKPAPKQFLRKGAAGQLEQILVVRDLSDPKTRFDYEAKIGSLQSELQRLRRGQQAARSGPRIVRRLVSLIRKGPRYAFGRFASRVGSLVKRG